MNYHDAVRPLEHSWELCVGSCHATTALREDYRRQLEKCHRELGFKYVRFHGLFNDDMSVMLDSGAIMNKESGEVVLSFTNTDSIFDFLLSIGMKPFVELGFMPSALTSGKCTLFHYKGLTSPPDDYGRWGWLVEQFVMHCVERYGLGEVRQWFFEVWNEPNLGGPGAPTGFWGGSMEEYFKLYEAAARAVKSVDHKLPVGGPASSDGEWIPELIDFCRTNDVPLDFVSTHNYPTDYVNGSNHGSMETGAKLMEALAAGGGEELEEVIKVMIEGQKNMWQKIPRGVLKQFAREAYEQAQGLPLYYTEWSSGAGIPSDGPFGASFIAKTCLDNVGLVKGYSHWTFSDIFEEGGMPHTPFHGGHGLLNLQGIPKASYRAFELLHKLGDEMYENVYSKGTVDVYAVRNNACSAVQFMIVNHNSLQQKIEDETVTVTVEGLSSPVKATVERIDENHANALRRWQDLGEPDYPSEAVICDIMSHSYTAEEAMEVKQQGTEAEVTLTVPAQGIALVTLYL